MRTLLALVALLSPLAAFADGATALRQRYDPGLGVGVLTSVQGFESLSGASAGAGVDVNYAFDLVGLDLRVIQSLANVGGKHPTQLGLGFDYAFATFGAFSVVGNVGADLVLNGPDAATQTATTLFGPEAGLGARYRFDTFDVRARGFAGVWAGATNREYFDPGVELALVFHPWADGS